MHSDSSTRDGSVFGSSSSYSRYHEDDGSNSSSNQGLGCLATRSLWLSLLAMFIVSNLKLVSNDAILSYRVQALEQQQKGLLNTTTSANATAYERNSFLAFWFGSYRSGSALRATQPKEEPVATTAETPTNPTEPGQQDMHQQHKAPPTLPPVSAASAAAARSRIEQLHAALPHNVKGASRIHHQLAVNADAARQQRDSKEANLTTGAKADRHHPDAAVNETGTHSSQHETNQTTLKGKRSSLDAVKTPAQASSAIVSANQWSNASAPVQHADSNNSTSLVRVNGTRHSEKHGGSDFKHDPSPATYTSTAVKGEAREDLRSKTAETVATASAPSQAQAASPPINTSAFAFATSSMERQKHDSPAYSASDAAVDDPRATSTNSSASALAASSRQDDVAMAPASDFAANRSAARTPSTNTSTSALTDHKNYTTGSSVARPTNHTGATWAQAANSDGGDTTARNASVITTSRQLPLWESLPTANVLPAWLKEYFVWHAQQINELNSSNWSSKKFLVMRCLSRDPKCDGTSDRLQHVPLSLMLASQSRRILLILWQRPHPLTEFLVAPAGGLNWTVPAWLEHHILEGMNHGRGAKLMSERSIAVPRESSDVVVDMKFHTKDHGRALFNSYQNRTAIKNSGLNPSEVSSFYTFDQLYHTLWSILFTPAPPVQQRIDDSMRELGLVPNQYVSLHIRALYWNDQASNLGWIYNGVHCAAQLWKDAPIYVASDSPNATMRAVRYGQSLRNGTGLDIGGRGVNDEVASEQQPQLHLDRGGEFLNKGEIFKSYPPSAYYDTFVDLYLLAGGRCTAFDVGGYGKWANIMSSNSSCFVSTLHTNCMHNARQSRGHQRKG